METYEQKLISDALNFAHLTTLPKNADPQKSLWLDAVAKIRLANNSVAYGVVKRNADLSYRVTYVNGATAAIVEVEEVYPYVVLDKQYIKKFPKGSDESDRIAYLKSLNLPYVVEGYFDSMDIEELNKEVVKAALYQQLKAMEE